MTKKAKSKKINTESIAVAPDDKTIKTKKSTSSNKKTTLKPKAFIPRLLCFTNIDAKKTHPYSFLENILNQSYPEVYYIFNIFIESKNDEILYKKILKKFFNPTKIKINFFLHNTHDIQDHLIGFSNFERQSYNMFFYINSDAIYLENYISDIISAYDPGSDISNIKFDKNLSNKYNYILNNKTLDILIKQKSSATNNSWMLLIEDHNLSIKEIENISSAILVNTKEPEQEVRNSNHKNDYYNLIDNEFFTVCIFEHNFWSSYIYLNKRNNRMYNIYNDDHGAFNIKDDNSIIINWDTWGEEIFYKKNIDNIYYYSIHK